MLSENNTRCIHRIQARFDVWSCSDKTRLWNLTTETTANNLYKRILSIQQWTVAHNIIFVQLPTRAKLAIIRKGNQKKIRQVLIHIQNRSGWRNNPKNNNLRLHAWQYNQIVKMTWFMKMRRPTWKRLTIQFSTFKKIIIIFWYKPLLHMFLRMNSYARVCWKIYCFDNM